MLGSKNFILGVKELLRHFVVGKQMTIQFEIQEKSGFSIENGLETILEFL